MTLAATIAARARANGVPFQKELLVAGIVSEESIARAVAVELGVSYLDRPDPESLLISEGSCLRALRLKDGAPFVQAASREGSSIYLLSVLRIDLAAMRELLRRNPAMAARLRVVAPGGLRRALLHRSRQALGRHARHGLFDRLPTLSARIVATAWQGTVFGMLIVVLPLCIALARSSTQIAAHCFGSLFFLACVVLRLAVSAGGAGRPRDPVPREPDPAQMPVYTVLVALYREAAMVPELMVALGKIEWPRSKLEVKLVCEADDLETLAALKAQGPRPWVEVIEVPPGGPRTKPKALSYALPACAGEFVVLYDAEDKPHHLQLVEAWQRFRASGENLACLQAPLSISNIGQGMLPRLFALEYAALFRGMLPWLARRVGFFPLGGTSNHFRRSALERSGGWDPYNVTEDADLGMRLKRFGYRIDTLTCPTWEAAPDTAGVWLAQRTRWFKGWAQTWLVHMRRPDHLMRDLGPVSFTLAQILIAGMLASALIHPLFLVSAIWYAARLLGGDASGIGGTLLTLDIVNIVGGYLAFLVLGWQTLSPRERRGYFWTALATPLYWSLMSLAAWRALWQLYRRPHFWAKTPHRPARRGRGQTAA